MAMVKKPDRTTTGLRTAVLVLGMHRSGTSALARLVNFHGAALPRHLVPADQSNPRGYWESKPLVALHDELLQALDSSWDDWRTPGSRWKESDAATRFAGPIRLAIDEEFGNAPMFVLKDPRMCRTLPYWMSILEKSGIRTAPLIIVRNPLEVAESLQARDGISFEKAMLLWLRHNLDVEYETRHLQRNIVTFDALLEDWKLLAEQSGARLGITWARQPPMQDVRDFLDNEMHNHRSTQAELDAHTEVPQWVKAAYRALALLCEEPKSAEPKRELDRVRHAFAESSKIFGGVAFAQTDALKQAARDVAAANLKADAADALRADLARTREQHAAAAAKAQELEGSLAGMTARANEYEQVAHEFETALSQLKLEAKDAEAAERRVVELTKQLADVERRRAQAEQALARVNADSGELRALAKHLSERTEWIEGELKTQHTKSSKTTAELEATRAQALAMSASLQSALANAMSLTKETAAAKDQLHIHEARAVKAMTEARQHQEALQAARNRIAALEADERAAQAEIVELRAELADVWARGNDVPVHVAHAPILRTAPDTAHANAPAARQQTDTVELVPQQARDLGEVEIRAKRIEDDLRFERMHVKQLERRLTTWMGLASAALRKITRLGGSSNRKAPGRPRIAGPSVASQN